MTIPKFDVILRNGLVVDGTGSPGFVADIAIAGDRIAKIGSLRTEHAVLDIDVGGLAVSPACIDVHTHDDAALILRPQMTAKLTQGITTVIGGNYGIRVLHTIGMPPLPACFGWFSNRITARPRPLAVTSPRCARLARP